MKCEGERSEECKGDEGERGESEKLKREERVKNVGEKEKYITIIITTIIKITENSPIFVSNGAANDFLTAYVALSMDVALEKSVTGNTPRPGQ